MNVLKSNLLLNFLYKKASFSRYSILNAIKKSYHYD